MGIFKKKAKPKPEQVIAYSEVEQGIVEPTEPADPFVELSEKIAKVLSNQATIVQNQQVILDSITATQQLILRFAGEDEPEPEPSEEEIQAAIAEARAKKKGGKA